MLHLHSATQIWAPETQTILRRKRLVGHFLHSSRLTHVSSLSKETRGMRKRVLSQRSLYPLLNHLSKDRSQRHSTWGSVSILQSSKSNVELSRWPETLLWSLCLICCDTGKAAEGKVHLAVKHLLAGLLRSQGAHVTMNKPHSRSKPAQA